MDPELIGSVTGSISVLLVAVAFALLVTFIHRKMIPRYGVKRNRRRKYGLNKPKYAIWHLGEYIALFFLF